jgi:sugar-specific transcriptional regulator TrmB
VREKLTIESLDEFGLNSYEAKSYLSLLEKNKMNAAEISRIAGIPRSRVYDTLAQLELKGLCRVISGKIKSYTAVDPSQLKDVLTNLERERTDSMIKKYQDEIKKEKDRLVEKIKNAEGLVERLIPIYKQNQENNNDSEYIEVIKDPLLIHKKTCEILANAKKEILGFTRPPFVATQKIPEQVNVNIEASQQGVTLRNIYEIPTNIMDLKYMLEMIKREEAIFRISDMLPIKLVIVDEEIVLFSLNESLTLSRPFVISALVKHKNLAQFYKMAFEMMWAKSRDMNADELKFKLQKMIEERE